MSNTIEMIKEFIGEPDYSGNSYLLYLHPDGAEVQELNVQLTPRDGERGGKGRVVAQIEFGVKSGNYKTEEKVDVLIKNNSLTQDTRDKITRTLKKLVREANLKHPVLQ